LGDLISKFGDLKTLNLGLACSLGEIMLDNSRMTEFTFGKADFTIKLLISPFNS
jgi:hypothetical protein